MRPTCVARRICAADQQAQRELGWTHFATDGMWDRIVAEERALMARRQGFLERLRRQSVLE